MIEEIAGGFVPFLVVVAVMVVVGLIWWGRKATKYPEWAAKEEAKFDEHLEWLKKYAPDQVDRVLEKIQDADAVSAGQSLYANIQRRLNTIEAKVNELLSRSPK